MILIPSCSKSLKIVLWLRWELCTHAFCSESAVEMATGLSNLLCVHTTSCVPDQSLSAQGFVNAKMKLFIWYGKMCMLETCMNSKKWLDKLIEEKSNIPHCFCKPWVCQQVETGRGTIITCLSFYYTLSLASVAGHSKRWDSVTGCRATVTGGYCCDYFGSICTEGNCYVNAN